MPQEHNNMAAVMTCLRCTISLQPRSSLLHALKQAPRPAKLSDDSSEYLPYALPNLDAG